MQSFSVVQEHRKSTEIECVGASKGLWENAGPLATFAGKTALPTLPRLSALNLRACHLSTF